MSLQAKSYRPAMPICAKFNRRLKDHVVRRDDEKLLGEAPEMLIGEEYWDTSITCDMVEMSAGGRSVKTFPNLPSSIYDMLARTAAAYGDKVGIWTHRMQPYAYSEILRLADRLAEHLAQFGIRRGSRVGVILGNSIEFVVSYFAINSLGAVIVCLPGKFRKPELQRLASRSRLTALICEEAYAEWLRPEDCGILYTITPHDSEHGFGFRDLIDINDHGPRAIGSSSVLTDDAILAYTSGTTTLAKGVLITNLNVAASATAYERVLEITPGDSSIISAPIYYVTGLVGLLTLFVKAGGTIYLQQRVNGCELLEAVTRNAITFLHASPAVFNIILAEREHYPEVPSVRLIVCGASYMPISNIGKLHDWMPAMSFRTAYGLTESTSPGTIFPDDAAVSEMIGAAGIPLPGVHIQIRDFDDIEQGHGNTGEIWIQGPNITRGYDGLHTTDLTADGWLRTGDIGYTTSNGYLYIVDRTKDSINRGGEKIWCFDVEEELRRIESIQDAVVVGIPDEKYGEIAVAAVTVLPGHEFDESAARAELATRIARYKIPVHFYIVGKIPLTANFKVDKSAVRMMLTDVVSGCRNCRVP